MGFEVTSNVRNLQERILRKLDVRTHRFVSACSGKLISYSQLGEDVWIFQNFLNRPVDDAVLLEVGSYDGVTYSNTLLFERFAKGRYVLIEPAQSAFERCRKFRANAHVLRCAISDSYGEVHLLGDSSLSGITEHLSREYVDEWGLQDAVVQDVRALPLAAVVLMQGLQFIDVLSVDVQGAELAVLQGIDWSTPIGCITLEVEDRDREKDQMCRAILREQGFDYQVRLGVSEIWTQADYLRRTSLFDEARPRSLNDFLFPYLEPGCRGEILEVLSNSAT